MKAGDVEEYENALVVYEKMLAFEMDSIQRSNIQRKRGDIYLEFSKLERNLESFQCAIQAYRSALEVYTKEGYLNPRAKVLRKLGISIRGRSRTGGSSSES